MELQAFIQAERGNGVRLAAQLGIPLSYLWQLATGVRTINPERAVSIEDFSRGLVPVETSVKDKQWIRVKDKSWPHQGGRPLLDLAASRSEVKEGA